MSILDDIPTKLWRGLRPSIGTDGRFHAKAICHDCHQSTSWSTNKAVAPNLAIPAIERRGWDIGKSLHTCPKCKARERVRKVAERSIDHGKPLAVAPQATPAAKQVHKAVWEALFSAYDDDKKRYSTGYSDDRIARETGAAVEHVAKIREEHFGPCGEPAELAALRGELSKLHQDIENITARVEASVKPLRDKADTLSVRLGNITRQNGWAE